LMLVPGLAFTLSGERLGRWAIARQLRPILQPQHLRLQPGANLNIGDSRQSMADAANLIK
jgi:hypothetical protein